MMHSRSRALFVDEAGFTTTSMVLALLISLSLLFSAAQVYRINTASAEVQHVADAAALSAETQVAEFVLLARLCDAVVLSLSLTGLTIEGLGIVALCTPATAAISESLLDMGKQVLQSRDAFAHRAAEVLERMQMALPFMAAACAASVAAANNGNISGSAYIACAVLVPTQGKPIAAENAQEAQDLADEVDGQADCVRDYARQAEEAMKEANAAKERAFRRDCGDAPGYCMYERAAHLAYLSASENPLYSSVDAWSFSVALNRAKAYYAARLSQEEPENASIAEQARSALRTRFYRYAVSEMRKAYVHETDDSFEAYLPILPKNTAEMRETELYTQAVYPITENAEGQRIMHAWSGCPGVSNVVGVGSIYEMEQSAFETCPYCEFRASSMGAVAAASTSIENGFEYHYRAVAEEAQVYEKARKKAEGPRAEVKRRTASLLEKLEDLIGLTASKRIEVMPPGSFGCIAFVVNAGSTSAAGGFASSFVAGEGTLGPRAAISAATIVEEGTSEGSTIITSFLDGLKEDAGAALGVSELLLTCWSGALDAYGRGQESVTQVIEEGLDSLPLMGASGLGTWAAKKLKDVTEAVGLQPAKLSALKPVLVNSGHIAAKAGSDAAEGLVGIKQALIAHPLTSTDLFSSVLTETEQMAIQSLDEMGSELEIASIELFGDEGLSIPIVIPLPEVVTSAATSALQDAFACIRTWYITTSGVRVWE